MSSIQVKQSNESESKEMVPPKRLRVKRPQMAKPFYIADEVKSLSDTDVKSEEAISKEHPRPKVSESTSLDTGVDGKKVEEKDGMTTEEYNVIIAEIEFIAKSIGVKRGDGDGRIESASKEKPFLEDMKRILGERHPEWVVVISPPRASYDIMVNSIQINLKLTDCKTADNSVNKPSIYYSITGRTTYPYASNWNEFLDKLMDAKRMNQIKRQRHKPTEYHYLVKNKLTGDVLLKPLFDIHTYVDNPSNDLQIKWKNEFVHYSYRTDDAKYMKKVEELVGCIQQSVKQMIERTRRFAEADISALLSEEESHY